MHDEYYVIFDNNVNNNYNIITQRVVSISVTDVIRALGGLNESNRGSMAMRTSQ